MQICLENKRNPILFNLQKREKNNNMSQECRQNKCLQRAKQKALERPNKSPYKGKIFGPLEQFLQNWFQKIWPNPRNKNKTKPKMATNWRSLRTPKTKHQNTSTYLYMNRRSEVETKNKVIDEYSTKRKLETQTKIKTWTIGAILTKLVPK